MVRATRSFRRALIRRCCWLSPAAGGLGRGLTAQDAAQPQRAFTLTASKYRFDPPRLEVDQNDLVKITLESADIAHSFTVDGYRIAKRAGPGQTVTFEFRADQPGTFRFYCNLKQDERCKEMQGELVVHPKWGPWHDVASSYIAIRLPSCRGEPLSERRVTVEQPLREA